MLHCIAFQVTAGTVNYEGPITIKATSTGTDSTLAGIGRLVADAQAREAPVQRLADAVAGKFCYSVMAASAATFAFWSLAGHPCSLSCMCLPRCTSLILLVRVLLDLVVLFLVSCRCAGKLDPSLCVTETVLSEAVVQLSCWQICVLLPDNSGMLSATAAHCSEGGNHSSTLQLSCDMLPSTCRSKSTHSFGSQLRIQSSTFTSASSQAGISRAMGGKAKPNI